MRSFLFSVLLLAGCGGNWSNTDLAFANALPRRDELKSRIPAGSTTQPLDGVGTRRDGLNVGDPSGAFAATRKAAADFNGLLDLILGVLDQVRAVAPTTRTGDSRTWGPFADSNNPGRELQVVIVKKDDVNFEWRIESRAINAAFIQVVTGNFLATDTARRGRGALVVHVKDFRDVLKVDDNLKQLNQIDMGYVTDMFPRRVEMLFTLKDASPLGISSIGYTARAQADGSGAMRFVYTLPRTDLAELELTAVWAPSGEGKGVGTVTRGTNAGFTVNECWGKSFSVVYYAESWPGGVTSGLASDCIVIDGL